MATPTQNIAHNTYRLLCLGSEENCVLCAGIVTNESSQQKTVVKTDNGFKFDNAWVAFTPPEPPKGRHSAGSHPACTM